MARTDFDEIEVLRDSDGLVAVLSERRRNGSVSFMIAREFDRDGVITRSSFLKRCHIAGARRLLDQLDAKLDFLEDRTRSARRTA